MDTETNEDDITWSDQDIYYATPIENLVGITQDSICVDIPASSSTIHDGSAIQKSDSEDEISLADIQRRQGLRLPVKRKLIVPSEEDTDDSVHDETYKPSKDDTTSTDSGNETVLGKHKRKRRFQREKPWKKIPKHTKIKQIKTGIKERREKAQRDVHQKLTNRIKLLQNKRHKKKSDSSPLERAKRLSKKIHTVQTIVRRSHISRLDHLLASNELKRVNVRGDGNCFFSALRESGNEFITDDVSEIRSNLSNFMSENSEQYISFCSSKTTDQVFGTEQFTSEIEKLKTSGQWNLSVGDVLPLAVANYYKCAVRIFSSSLSTPVIDIQPEIASEKVIHLAYMAIRGEEHYEATRHVHHIVVDSMGKEAKDDISTESPTLTDHIGGDDIQTTPHKRAAYQSPKKAVSSRKKKRNPEQWKRNIQKKKRISGSEYISSAGKVVPGKTVQAHKCTKCRFKCSEKISEEERKEIFDFYYALANYERQRQYICDMVETVSPTRKGKNKRSIAHKFYLPSRDKRLRVCRDFFLKTLDIKRKTVDYTTSKRQHGAYGGSDGRGKAKAVNRLDQKSVDFVKQHIESFPRMESHYSRKKSKKEYLAQDLNIKKMWNLYCSNCEKTNVSPVKLSKYRQIFCEDYNICFYKPKKDQCSLCELYKRKQAAGNIDEKLTEEYEEHQLNKVKAREEKEKDKERAKADSSVYVATFDLQAVLTTPCSLVSELYYCRKLCCYNLTIYSLRDKQVFCHLWDETQCKRGSSEIATCLMKNTMSVCSQSNVQEIVYISDTCSGQNRNQYVTSSFLYTLSQVPQLKTLSHKFLLSGHSQMECDSVHSTIETAKRKTSIFVPSQWSTLVSLARKTNPYVVVPMKYNHVVDFKKFVKKYCPNLKVSTSGQRIKWMHVKWIQVRQSSPKSVFVNYSFDMNSFLEIAVQTTTRQKGKLLKWPESAADLDMLYDSKLPISVQKKNDLVGLCTKEIIPEEFHTYFTSLKVSKTNRDIVPMSSDDEDTDIE